MRRRRPGVMAIMLAIVLIMREVHSECDSGSAVLDVCDSMIGFPFAAREPSQSLLDWKAWQLVKVRGCVWAFPDTRVVKCVNACWSRGVDVR